MIICFSCIYIPASIHFKYIYYKCFAQCENRGMGVYCWNSMHVIEKMILGVGIWFNLNLRKHSLWEYQIHPDWSSWRPWLDPDPISTACEKVKLQDFPPFIGLLSKYSTRSLRQSHKLKPNILSPIKLNPNENRKEILLYWLGLM